MDSCRTLRINDFELVQNYVNPNPDEFSPEMWSSPFREESLKHYLELNWSFGSFTQSGECEGIVLLQPFLFWNSLTQVIWMESLKAESKEIEMDLFQLAYKTCREKHMQALLFSKQREWKEVWNESKLEICFEFESPLIKTTKWS